MTSDNSAFVFPLDKTTGFFYSLEPVTLISVPALCFPPLLASFLYSFRHQPRVAESNGLLYAKLLMVSLLCCIDTLFAIVGYFLSYHDTTITAVLPCLMTWGLLAAVKLEHHFSWRPTSRLSIWLTLSLFSDFQRLQRYSLLPGPPHPATWFLSASLVLKLVLVLLGEPPKLLIAPEMDKDEETNTSEVNNGYSVGFWSRVLLFSLDPTLPAFFGRSDPISAEHLNQKITARQLSENDSASTSTSSSQSQSQSTPSSPSSSPSSSSWLFMTLCKSFFLAIVASCSSRLLLVALKLSQVTLLEKLLIFMQNKETSLIFKLELIGGAFCVVLGIAFARCLFKGLCDRLVLLLREALVTTVYRKIFATTDSQRQKAEFGRVLDTHIEGLANGIANVISSLGAVIEIVACMKWMLQLAEQPMHLIVILPSVLGYIIQYVKSSLPESWQTLETATNQRLKKTASLVTSIRGLKATALEDLYSEHLKRLRLAEVNELTQIVFSWKQAIINSGCIFWTLPGPIVFACLSLTSQSNSSYTVVVYSSLALVAIFIGSIMDALRIFTLTNTMLNCAERIQMFLFLRDLSMKNIESCSADTSLSSLPEDGARDCNSPVDELDLTASRQAQTPSMAKTCLVYAEEATLGSEALDQEPILDVVAIRINTSELTMVTGPSGCGKTTFLHSLMGRGALLSGQLLNTISVAGYCSQVPWLRQVSVRANITSYQEFEAEWYGRVVHACCLEQDFSQFVDGDLLLVGVNGQNLSRGQRSRIALARALYSRSSCLILDNVFEYLDEQTRDVVFNRIFGEGGIWHLHRGAVIMTTSCRDLLEKADKIIFINLSGLVTMHSDQQADYKSHLEELAYIQDKKGNTRHDDDGTRHHNNANANTDQPERNTFEMPLSSPNADFMTTCCGYLSCLEKSSIRRQVLYLGCAVVLLTLSDSFACLWFSVASPGYAFVLTYGAVSALACFVTFIACRTWFLEFAPVLAIDLHEKLINTVTSANIFFLMQFSHQGIMDLFDRDIKFASEVLPMSIGKVAHQGSVFLTQLCLIALVARYSSVFLAFHITGFCISLYWYMKLSGPAQSSDAKARTKMRAYLAEVLAGLHHFKAFGSEHQILAEGSDVLADSQSHLYYMRCIDRWMYLAVEGSRSLGILAIIILIVVYQTPVPILAVGVMLIVPMKAEDSTMILLEDCATLQSSFQTLETLLNFVDKTPVESNDVSEGVELDSNWPDKGDVTFHNVTARYSGKFPVPPVLKHIDLSLPAGYKIGITGRTGSGKSSLLMSMLNFLDHKGTISIDGVDIFGIPHRDLRERVTTISQEPLDLGETLRSNLLPRGNTSKNFILPESIDCILESLELSNAANTLYGLDTKVASLKLSDKQRRLISVARGVIRSLADGGNLILMDDIAGNLDPDTEALVVDFLLEAFPDTTIIMEISRSALLMHCDLIVHMQDGCIRRLHANPNGPASLREKLERAERKTAIEMDAKRARLEARRAAKRERNRLLAEVSSSSSDSDFWNSS